MGKLKTHESILSISHKNLTQRVILLKKHFQKMEFLKSQIEHHHRDGECNFKSQMLS